MSLSDTFLTQGRDMGKRLGLSFTQLLFVLNHESGINPAAHNPNGDASGLLQFMPSTLGGLGFSGSPEDFRSLSELQQLPYVERFYRSYAGKRLDSVGRIHQAAFLPATLDEGYGPGQVLARKDGTKWRGFEAAAYRDNAAAFDPEGKGYITTADLEKADLKAAKARGTRLQEALVRLKQLFPGDYKTAAGIWVATVLGGLGLAGGSYWYFFGRKGRR